MCVIFSSFIAKVNAAMGQTVKGMTNAMKAMDPVKISSTMEKFEQCFEDMDVASGTMEAAMESTTGNLTPPEEVDNLINEVADQAGLTLSGQMDSAGPVGTQNISTQEAGEDFLFVHAFNQYYLLTMTSASHISIKERRFGVPPCSIEERLKHSVVLP